MIDLKNVKVFADKDTELIKGINASLSEKAILVGPNGSGKTTLLRAICGIISYQGSILIDGIEVKGIKKDTKVSCNLPEAYTLGVKLKDQLELYQEIKDIDIKLASYRLKQVNIDLNKKYYSLSAGQKALFHTILALSNDPKQVLIDEPFENVDYAKRKLVASWLKEYGREGLIVTHELDLLDLFSPNTPLYLIFEGKLFGPIKLNDFLESNIVEGDDPSALVKIEISNKLFSIIKENKGQKIKNFGIIDKLYSEI
jgi:ABC-type multidrug transport system ATPase subunit